MDIPNIGDKGYFSCGTDAYPITVIGVSRNAFKITVRQENFVGDMENGHDYYGVQVWKFSEGPADRIESFYWTPSRKGWYSSTSRLYITGEWYAKQDPNF